MNIQRLPFDHEKQNFFEAVGVSAEKLANILANSIPFSSLPLEERIRVVACTAHFIINYAMENRYVTSVVFSLLTANKKPSECVEQLEEGVITLASKHPLGIERGVDDMYLVISSIVNGLISRDLEEFKQHAPIQ